MRVTYVVSDKMPVPDRANHVPVGIDVEVDRTCDLGNSTKVYQVRTLGEAAALPATIGTYIAADLASVVTQLGTQTTNLALKTAFELAMGSFFITFDI